MNVILNAIELDDADIIDELIHRGYDPSMSYKNYAIIIAKI